MNRIFLKMGFGLLAAGLAWTVSAALPGTMKQLHGHVPSVVSHLTALSRVNATNRLHLAIGLPLRNQDAVDSLLQQINDPASPNYHHYLTPEEFAAHFGPTEQDYQAVKDFIRAKGLTVSRADGNRMLLEVTGSASDVEKAFNVKLNKFRHPTENRDFFAPDQEPSVPVELSVLDVWGLSNYPKPRSSMRHIPSIAKKASPAPKAGSAPGGDYMGYDYRKAYVPGTTLTGTGQKVALVQFDGYFATDIAEYVRQTGLPTLSITNILLDGFDGNPTMTGGEGEVTLDIEMVNSMAPGLGQLLVYEQNPNNFNPNSVLNQIAMGLSGRIAEELVMGDVSSGAGGDIKQVTKIARHMVCDWGMSSLGMISYGDNSDTVFLGREITRNHAYSEETARKIDAEISRIVETQYARAKDIILGHRDALDKIAAALLEYETIEGKHVLELLNFGELRSPVVVEKPTKPDEKTADKKAAGKPASIPPLPASGAEPAATPA